MRPLLEPAGVVVAHLHGLMATLIAEAGLQERLPTVEPRDLFDIHYPEVALDALRCSIVSGRWTHSSSTRGKIC